MTEEELEKEAKEWLNKWELCNKCDHKVQCIEDNAICPQVVERAYLASAEPREKRIEELMLQIQSLGKENAELKKVAEFQQSSNMSRHFENKKLKEGLAVGSTFNKALNSMNKVLEEERDKYREMTFDMKDQLTKAKEIIKKLIEAIHIWDCKNLEEVEAEAEQFLNSEVEK